MLLVVIILLHTGCEVTSYLHNSTVRDGGQDCLVLVHLFYLSMCDHYLRFLLYFKVYFICPRLVTLGFLKPLQTSPLTYLNNPPHDLPERSDWKFSWSNKSRQGWIFQTLFSMNFHFFLCRFPSITSQRGNTVLGITEGGLWSGFCSPSVTVKSCKKGMTTLPALTIAMMATTNTYFFHCKYEHAVLFYYQRDWNLSFNLICVTKPIILTAAGHVWPTSDGQLSILWLFDTPREAILVMRLSPSAPRTAPSSAQPPSLSPSSRFPDGCDSKGFTETESMQRRAASPLQALHAAPVLNISAW